MIELLKPIVVDVKPAVKPTRKETDEKIQEFQQRQAPFG